MSDDLFELGERIAELAAGINIATYEMLTLVADFERREGWADNFASCAEWLAWRTGRTLAAARENVRVAHALAELPLTATAMKSGQLSYTKVRTMTRVATPETEATLLEYAQSTSAARLEWLVRGWKTLSRDGELAAEEVRHRSRTFSVAVDADGMYVVRGRLEPEVGAVLMRAIEAAGDALYRGVQPVEGPLGDQRGQFGRGAEASVAFVDHDAARGLARRFHQGLLVQRGKGARVDDLHAVPLAGKALRRREGARDHRHRGHQGHVRPFALDRGLPDGDRVRFPRPRGGRPAVLELRLQEADPAGQLLYRIAAVAQGSVLAVHIADGAGILRAVGKAPVNGDNPQLGAKTGDVKPPIAPGGLYQGQLQLAVPEQDSCIITHAPNYRPSERR